jgi:hypothetical protein
VSTIDEDGDRGQRREHPERGQAPAPDLASPRLPALAAKLRVVEV